MNSAAAFPPMTLKDVARAAGVSVATVDRVLHERPGVRPATVKRVRDTIDRFDFRPLAAAAELARAKTSRFAFVIPSGSNAFMASIREAVADLSGWLAARRASVEIIRADVFDPTGLAATLDGLAGRVDGVAVVALDHPRVRAAIDDLAGQGIPVVTVVSDVPASRRAHYVGIDNIAAGRTAGTLVGRFLGRRTGAVGVIAGSRALRDHAERLLGFHQVMVADFPVLTLLPPVEGLDDPGRTETLTAKLLAEHPDLIALYNAGAGNPGVAAALASAGRAEPLVFVGHELTADTRRLLVTGVMDAVIAQDPGHEARSAARIMMAIAAKHPILADQEKIRIEIILRDNLP